MNGVRNFRGHYEDPLGSSLIVNDHRIDHTCIRQGARKKGRPRSESLEEELREKEKKFTGEGLGGKEICGEEVGNDGRRSWKGARRELWNGRDRGKERVEGNCEGTGERDDGGRKEQGEMEPAALSIASKVLVFLEERHSRGSALMDQDGMSRRRERKGAWDTRGEQGNERDGTEEEEEGREEDEEGREEEEAGGEAEDEEEDDEDYDDEEDNEDNEDDDDDDEDGEVAEEEEDEDD